MKTSCLGLIVALIFAVEVQAQDYETLSPDGMVAVRISCTESKLTYALSWYGENLLEPSAISLFDQPAYTVVGTDTKDVDETWEPVWGQFSQVRDHCRQFTLHLTVSGAKVDLICQVYDDGVGLRFVVPSQPGLAGKSISYHFEWNTSSEIAGYFPNGENMPIGPLRLSEWSAARADRPKPLAMPAVFDIGDGAYMSLLESDLYTAKLFSTMSLSIKQGTHTIQHDARAIAESEGFITPWRVILLGKNLGDLLVNAVPLNLAAPCQIEDTGWIKPGKSLWDWRIHGYNNGDFVYGIDTRSYLRLIDFAAAQGIEYFTIDDNWYKNAKDGVVTVAPEVDIEKVMQYAKEKGVRIMLYYDRKKGDFGDDHLYPYYHALGASGIKYGFMGNAASFTRGANEDAAANQLLTNFHDGPTPMIGVGRTLPNAITREYCHAQQDSRRAFSPETFLKMAMVNALSGPLDQANGNFGIKSINAGERQKGPRKKNSYISTVTSEMARTLVIFSGLITLPDAPEEYLKKADLFEFLKQMPATWDESRVLHCKMGEYITTARRSGETWFVGSVNNEMPRELDIKLDFLKSGVSYHAMLFQDAKTSHGIDNPEAYDIASKSVTSSDVITARMVLGGGHAMILKPKHVE